MKDPLMNPQAWVALAYYDKPIVHDSGKMGNHRLAYGGEPSVVIDLLQMAMKDLPGFYDIVQRALKQHKNGTNDH